MLLAFFMVELLLYSISVYSCREFLARCVSISCVNLMSQRNPMFAGHMAVCCFAGFLMFDIDLLTGIDNTIDNICT